MAAASEDSAEAPAEMSGLSAAKTAKLYYATKTALSLTLAYLIPMAMGWPQPQTAAITVMLIAAAGAVSESLQKGVMRVIGTVAGAVIDLSLVALFPQDRMTYLLAVSLVVAAIVYLYNAYQADGTVFMLTAVVTMMVFNGGDAEGAFLYGVDRAFMTAFGVLVYTVVASMLWPVKSADNTREMAAGLTGVYGAAFDRLARESDHDSQQVDAAEEAIQAQLASLVVQAQDFHSHFVTVKGSANGVADYAPEWSTVVATFEELQETLVPALRQLGLQADTDYSRFIPNYGHALVRTGELFAHAEAT
ncbi:MAG: FUSC family protein, partial [Halioglobus sp.]